ncbi:hypothetical protein NEMBOFW57_008960 [Staphylotrichum longicolle]|uniref:Mid2 domain-containing protein n=1 Tax=Staphylotrichum longicolle TaxID=669026 RepID=A0AAD4ESC1_9PEZI|nr:hypothetical protein NEMBOFW57_008960 [Staphylotrichum longicolle]
MAGGSADLGPVVVRVTNGPQKQFDWPVQLYSFDLEVSNIFFFWLKEGGLDNVGLTNIQHMTSAYFNITDAPLPSSSSAISSATTSSSVATLPTTLVTTSSTPSPATTSSTSSTPVNVAPNQQEATANSNPPSESSTSSSDGGSLPVAAQAGIGVGVSVVGLTAIVCGILWFRYLRKQQRLLADLHHQAYPQQPPDATELWKLHPQVPPAAAQYPYHPHMVAAPRGGQGGFVELG